MSVTNFDALETRVKRVYIQRTPRISAASAAGILAAVTLHATLPTVITAFDAPPSGYRVLSITGNAATVEGTVHLHGTAWDDTPIQDDVATAGASTVPGNLPFKTITRAILPPRGAAGDTLSIGWADVLGLHFPLALAEDFITLARQTDETLNFARETPNAVSTANRTVTLDSPVNADDMFEMTYLTTGV